MRPIEEEPLDVRQKLQTEVGLQHEGKKGRKPRNNSRRKKRMAGTQEHQESQRQGYPRNRRVRDAADEATEYLNQHAGIRSAWNTAKSTAVAVCVAVPPLIGAGYVLMLVGRKVFRPV